MSTITYTAPQCSSPFQVWHNAAFVTTQTPKLPLLDTAAKQKFMTPFSSEYCSNGGKRWHDSRVELRSTEIQDLRRIMRCDSSLGLLC